MLDIFLLNWVKVALLALTIICFRLYKHFYEFTPSQFKVAFNSRPHFCGRSYEKTWLDLHFADPKSKILRLLCFMGIYAILFFHNSISFAIYYFLLLYFAIFHLLVIYHGFPPYLRVNMAEFNAQEKLNTQAFFWIYTGSRLLMLLNLTCILTNAIH